MKLTIKITILIAAVKFCFFPFTAFAQDDKLSKEVQVVRPYEPSISDAFKINLMPRIEDTIKVDPKFTYTLALRPVTTEFPVSPIPAAKMVSEPLLPVYNGFVKFGFGNYSSPLAELYYANERSKDFSYGAWLKHHSSFGSLSLANKDVVDAPFSKTQFSAFGKYIFSNSVLAANAGFDLNSYRFFAHDTSLANLAIPIPTVDKQKQQRFDMGISYYSTYSDSAHINYRASSGFRNFSDMHGNVQNSFNLKADLNKYFKKEIVGGTIELVHHMRNESLDSANNTIFRFAPWVGAFDKQWRVKAGVNIVIDANARETKGHFYPIASASYNIVSNYVIPYFEFSGYLKENDYASVMAENPWVRKGIDIWNTSHNLVISGGVKGNLSSKAAYNLGASFSIIDSMYFFVNIPDATNSFLLGQFDVVYDNIQRKRFFGELTLAPTNSILVYLKAEYNLYDLSNIQKAWHLPSFIGQIGASYNIKNKIVLKANTYLESERFAKGLNNKVITLNGITDINLGIEYRYNRKIGAFLDINNILAKRHQYWYLYPTQRFNMKLGFNFAF